MSKYWIPTVEVLSTQYADLLGHMINNFRKKIDQPNAKVTILSGNSINYPGTTDFFAFVEYLKEEEINEEAV